MKKNKILITFLVIILFGLTGCTKQLKGTDGKVVQNKETGQALTSNVLCAPANKDILKLYDETRESFISKYEKDLKDGEIGKKEYDKKMDSLLDINKVVACKDFAITTGGYDGIWTTIFVKPLAWVLLEIGEFLGNYGLSIIFVTLLIRLIMFPITQKTARQSENLKIAKPKLDKLEKKYAGKSDQESTLKKSQEMMAIYKSHNINPMAGCLYGFIQIPLFFAFYEAMYRLPIMFEGNLLGFSLATAPFKGITSGNWLYAILPILVFAATYFSFKLNSGAMLGKDQEKQMKIMMNVMMVMVFFMSFNMPTGIIFYWVTNNTFTIVQNLIVKRSK
jgi:membrane protein insertase, YidC/Oxa1 family, C-terminal domain